MRVPQMASNTNNRIAIKWIRDKAKSAYIKMPCCHICAATEDLELHQENTIAFTYIDLLSHQKDHCSSYK